MQNKHFRHLSSFIHFSSSFILYTVFFPVVQQFNHTAHIAHSSYLGNPFITTTMSTEEQLLTSCRTSRLLPNRITPSDKLLTTFEHTTTTSWPENHRHEQTPRLFTTTAEIVHYTASTTTYETPSFTRTSFNVWRMHENFRQRHWQHLQQQQLEHRNSTNVEVPQESWRWRSPLFLFTF